jgi:hypothetical protein
LRPVIVINNKSVLLAHLNLTGHWKDMLASYIEIGIDYGHHASEERHNISEE